MADVKTLIKSHQGVPYQGIGDAPESHFRYAGYDVEVIHYKIDGSVNGFASSAAISTNLKVVYTGKVILLDGTGNASTTYLVKPGAGGNAIVTNLDQLAAGAAFILVVYGSTV